MPPEWHSAHAFELFSKGAPVHAWFLPPLLDKKTRQVAVNKKINVILIQQKYSSVTQNGSKGLTVNKEYG